MSTRRDKNKREVLLPADGRLLSVCTLRDRKGVRIVPLDSYVTVEVSESSELSHASRMNKAVVVFLKNEPKVHQLIESGEVVRDLLVQVSPLSVRSTRITVSGVPSFIPNVLLENELRRFGKLASGC
ncbi:unnamed protein product [Menidia menidia]|uniref:(Atlantic silverside) hypothetical protein n=1 Tax=Menidia menidia TaxID=238744 RepID=A0A8S4BVL0_9TELE|nr:unnamed protein product [Menidia menidia]